MVEGDVASIQEASLEAGPDAHLPLGLVVSLVCVPSWPEALRVGSGDPAPGGQDSLKRRKGS